MFHLPNFGIALALFPTLPSNLGQIRRRFKIKLNKCKRYLSEEVLYVCLFAWQIRSVQRGPIAPLIFDVPVLKFG